MPRLDARKKKLLRHDTDFLWFTLVHLQPVCAIGQTTTDPCEGPLEADHVERRWKKSRHDLTLGVRLCAKHHRYGMTISHHARPAMFRNWWNNVGRAFIAEYNKTLYGGRGAAPDNETLEEAHERLSSIAGQAQV